jgi:hypothetical protein
MEVTIQAAVAVKAKPASNTLPLLVPRKRLQLALVVQQTPVLALAAQATLLCMSTANVALYACASWRTITRGIDQVLYGEQSHELRNGAKRRDREYY